MTPRPFLLALLALSLTSCSQGFFTATGTLASQGDHQHTWKWPPNGCTRDPFDGRPPQDSTSIATLLWQDPAALDHMYDIYHPLSPDAPLRLELSRTPPGSPGPVVATLHTKRNFGVRLDPTVCTRFHITTQQTPAPSPETLPQLSGDIQLDCRTPDSHLTANIHFAHCDY